MACRAIEIDEAEERRAETSLCDVLTFESDNEGTVLLTFDVSDLGSKYFASIDDIDLGCRADSLDVIEVNTKSAERFIVHVDQYRLVSV
jgi:hypothetical protein